MAVRAPIPDLAPGERTLARDASRYLCRVLRMKEGATFVAFDPEARTEADAMIVRSDDDAAVARVGELRPAKVVADRPLVLLYALAKGDKVDAVVRDATELGATRVVVARTARAVVKAEGDREEKKLDRWRRVAEQAARQSGRADPPAIDGVLDWEDALTVAASCDARYVLAVGAATPLGALLPDAIGRGDAIAFAIGPEGGLAPDEIAAAEARGFLPVSLGDIVLRTETVAAAVLGAVRVLRAG
jgi:16S rRNA (uracil1498-N3)-methyltransferase